MSDVLAAAEPEPAQEALWPCCWENCPRPAVYAVTFHGQAGHVHDCAPHTAALREWSDVARIVALPCPFPHGAATWTDTPADLVVDLEP